jgi:hypothetical protein
MSRAEEILAHKAALETQLNTPININERGFTNKISASEKALSLALKIVIILGALISGLFFMGFLAFSGFFDSSIAMLTLSFIMFGLAIFMELKYAATISANAFNLVFYIIGFSALGGALNWLKVDENSTITMLLILSFAVLAFSKSHITTFSAGIGSNFLIFILIVTNDYYELLNLHAIVLAVICYGLFKYEGAFTKLPINYSRMFYPLRSALSISLVFALAAIGFNRIAELDMHLTWLSGIVFLFLIAYTLFESNISGSEKLIRIRQSAVAAIILCPLVFAPAVLGGLFITLLSFRTRYRTGIALGVICFLYFIGQFYYDLKITLFYKSMLMLGTGLLFLLIQFILHKKNYFDEKA